MRKRLEDNWGLGDGEERRVELGKWVRLFSMKGGQKRWKKKVGFGLREEKQWRGSDWELRWLRRERIKEGFVRIRDIIKVIEYLTSQCRAGIWKNKSVSICGQGRTYLV